MTASHRAIFSKIFRIPNRSPIDIMPIAINTLADNIVQHMRLHNQNVLTLRWSDFYRLCERDRLRQSFLDGLSSRLAESSIVMACGKATVAFVNDFDFAPYRSANSSGR